MAIVNDLQVYSFLKPDSLTTLLRFSMMSYKAWQLVSCDYLRSSQLPVN